MWSVQELASEAGKDAGQAHVPSVKVRTILRKRKKSPCTLNMNLNSKYMNIWLFFFHPCLIWKESLSTIQLLGVPFCLSCINRVQVRYILRPFLIPLKWKNIKDTWEAVRCWNSSRILPVFWSVIKSTAAFKMTYLFQIFQNI